MSISSSIAAPLERALARPLDAEDLARSYAAARPFPHLILDGFLDEAFAREAADSYPSYNTALQRGRSFWGFRERRKVQMTRLSSFPAPVTRLHALLTSPGFVSRLEALTGIANLVPDTDLEGAGMQVMGPGGRLGVHLDFNTLEARGLHRRLDLILYFNEGWSPDWGGDLELWDGDVARCLQAYTPSFNRACLLSSTDRSWRGVTKVRCPEDVSRKSFAIFYYTREPPPAWDGQEHSTIFRDPPAEALAGLTLDLGTHSMEALRSGARRIWHLFGR